MAAGYCRPLIRPRKPSLEWLVHSETCLIVHEYFSAFTDIQVSASVRRLQVAFRPVRTSAATNAGHDRFPNIFMTRYCSAATYGFTILAGSTTRSNSS
jgi:hypothetical protein